jgi:hypothetical protein
MSYRWVNKDPNEILDYNVDWSRWLDGATIASINWYVDNENGVKTLITNGQVVNGIQRVSASNTSTVATIHLGLGVINREYKFYCAIADSTGSIAERVIKLNIKEQ